MDCKALTRASHAGAPQGDLRHAVGQAQSASKDSAHGRMAAGRGTSCTEMRTRPPSRCTVPVTTASTPSSWAASRGGLGLSA